MMCAMAEMAETRVLVVDDDQRIAAAVRRALSYEGYDVSVAHNGSAALEDIATTEPHLVILDVMMPGMDGIEVCRRLRRAGNSVPVLMLTAKSEVPDRVEGLDAGADDYLVKPFAYPELLARVRTLLRRRPDENEREILRFSDVAMDVGAMEVHRNGRLVDFTALEFQLFEYFMRNPRIVLSRSQILIEVWGLDAETTSNVVDVYVRYLRQKLESGDEARILHTVRGAGYVLKHV